VAEKMMGSLGDEIRKAREEANILAEETRIMRENVDEIGKTVSERIRKANKRLQKLRPAKPANDN
jgi:uncharacterized coiled-coil DUF342 family protein